MAGPAVIDHAENRPAHLIGEARNGNMIPQDRVVNGQILSAPVKPVPMWAPEPRPAYVFQGLNGFIADAARRAGFGDDNESGSLLAKLHGDWFVKQAAQSLTNASTTTDPTAIEQSIRRVKLIRAALMAAVEGIGDALADREPESIETPAPEITEHGSRHLRPGKPGKLGRDVHRSPE